MSGNNRHLLLIGFTLVGGAFGFYVEEKVESYYKVSAARACLYYIRLASSAHAEPTKLSE